MSNSTYDQLLTHSKIMLIWAREENWTALLEEEAKYVCEVERLNVQGEQYSAGSPPDKQQSTMLEQILKNGAEIRERLIASRDRIGELMKVAQCRDKLTGTYGVVQTEPMGYGQMEHQTGL
ncbi:MAG: flagellar protein FliT [Porticoccus sp.]|nr:flagellar protein FliT [Porticoccus sp.]MBQ0808472.1 flagellar protein FliT [Porticoccus sp.]